MIGDGELSRDLAALVVPRSSAVWSRPATVMSRTGWSTRTGWRWSRSPLTSGIFWRRGGRSPRSARMGWTCCAGSGSCGRPRSPWDRATRVEARDFCQVAAGRRQAAHVRTGAAGQVTEVRSRPGRAVCAVGSCAQRDGAAGLLRFSPGGGHRAGHQPVPAASVPTRRAGECAPQSDGALPQRARRALPAEGAQPDPAQRAGRGVQRDLRGVAVAPGPGAGRLLRVHRSAGIGVAVGHAGGSRSGTPADHGRA